MVFSTTNTGDYKHRNTMNNKPYKIGISHKFTVYLSSRLILQVIKSGYFKLMFNYFSNDIIIQQ